MKVNVTKMVKYVLVFFILSVLCVNIVWPAFHKDVDSSYKEYLSQLNFESESEGTEKILSIDDNDEALLWRLRMISNAKKSIIMATFDLRGDESGSAVMSALYNSAQKGVKVRLLIDGAYEKIYLKDCDIFKTLCQHQNVEARFYNPVRISNIYKLNYRMHDKYIIIDDKMYLLGGRNTNDIFLGELHKGSNVDRDILVYNTVDGEGESYRQLLDYFNIIWNESCVENVNDKINDQRKEKAGRLLDEKYIKLIDKYEDFDKYNDWEKDTFDANKITLISNETFAKNKEPRILYAIEQLALKRESIMIQTPYAICNDKMYKVFNNIEKNSEIEVIINAVEKGSNPWGCTDYLNNKGDLLKTGIDIYELMNEYAVHTKTVLLDDNISVVGSYNLDMRSTYLDTELMIVIDSEELNSHIKEISKDYKGKSLQVLSNRTEIEGEYYKKRELSAKKQRYYLILRVITKPFRYLL